MGLIATARRGTTAPQDAPKHHAKGAARMEARDASQAKRTRRKARVVIGRPRAATRGGTIDQVLANIFRPVAGMNHNPPQ